MKKYIYLLTLFSFLWASEEFKLRGSTNGSETRLMTQFYEWPENLDGFKLKIRSDSSSKWKERFSNLFRPRISSKEAWLGQFFSPELLAQYEDSLKQRAKRNQKELSYAEVAKMYEGGSRREIKGDFSSMKRNFNFALFLGLAAVDEACTPGSEYGMFLQKKGKVQRKPVSTFKCSDISKWKWDKVGYDFNLFSNKIDITTSFSRKRYIERELFLLEYSVEIEERKRLISSTYPFIQSKKLVSYKHTDENGVFGKEQKYFLRYINNLGHVVHKAEVIRDLRPNLLGKVRRVNIFNTNRKGEDFEFDLQYPFLSMDTSLIANFTLLMVDTMQGDTVFKQTLPKSSLLKSGFTKFKIEYKNMKAPLLSTTLRMQVLTNTINERYRSSLYAFWKFNALLPLHIDSVMLSSDAIRFKIPNDLDSLKCKNFRYKVISEGNNIYRIGGLSTSSGSNISIAIFGLKEGVIASDTLKYTFFKPSSRDPFHRFSIWFKGNSPVFQWTLHNWVPKDTMATHFSLAKFLGDSLVDVYKVPYVRGQEKYRFIGPDIQDTLSYTFQASMDYANGFQRKKEKVIPVKNPEVHVAGEPMTVSLFGWHKPRPNMYRYLTFIANNDHLHGVDKLKMYLYKNDKERIATFKPESYDFNLGFWFDPRHAFDGDSVTIEIYHKNTKGQWVDKPFVKKILDYWGVLPTGYKLKVTDGVLSWQGRDQEGIKHWVIYNKGKEVAKSKTNSWKVPSKFQKSGSVFQVKRVAVYGDESVISKPFVWE